MPIEDNAKALPLSGGAVLPLGGDTNIYSSYADFTKAQADRQQQELEHFNNMANSVLERQDYGMTGVFGEFTRNMTGLNQAQDTYNALRDFYSPRNMSAVSSNLNALASSVTGIANVFGQTDPQDISDTGKALEVKGQDPSLAVSISPELREQIKKEAKVISSSWDSFLAQHQNLARWLSDPYNYARVNGDLQGQSRLAKALQDGAVGALAQELRNERGQLYLRMQRDSDYLMPEEDKERIRILNAMIKRLQPHATGSLNIDDTLPYALGGMATTLGEAASYVAPSAATGAVYGYAVGNAPGAVAGAIGGAGKGLLFGFA